MKQLNKRYSIKSKAQGIPGDDRCVLMFGDKKQMEEMIRRANPRLAQRFKMADAFTFDDHSDMSMGVQKVRTLKENSKNSF